MSTYQLVMHSGPTLGKVFQLVDDVVTIGHDAGNSIVIKDAKVSKKHVQLVFQGGKYIIADLGSTAGTFINGKPLTSINILRSGDVISLGGQIQLLYQGPEIPHIKRADGKNSQIDSTPSLVRPMPVTNIPTTIEQTHKMQVFLCHSSHDKPVVRSLYQKLSTEGWIDPWLDEEKLLPGQNWETEIEKAVESSDAVIVFLSNNSINKEGYVQRELHSVLDVALTKPEETIFVIPLRLEECKPPQALRGKHYVDFFPEEQSKRAYDRLLKSLKIRYHNKY